MFCLFPLAKLNLIGALLLVLQSKILFLIFQNVNLNHLFKCWNGFIVKCHIKRFIVRPSAKKNTLQYFVSEQH